MERFSHVKNRFILTTFFLIFQGRFTMAAKNHITIAEIYENNLVDLEKVLLINVVIQNPKQLTISKRV